VNSIRSTLGIGRGALAWIIPGLLIGFTTLPAVGIVAANVIAEPFAEQLPGHPEYYGTVFFVLFVFSAIAGPQVLCPDRRDGVISLYLVRPITATDYIVARWAALFTVMLAVVLVGQTLLFAGLILAAGDPVEYVRENWTDVVRFVASGLVISVLLTTIPLLISSFSTRRVIAALMIVGVFFLTSAFAGALSECEPDREGRCEPVTREYAKWFALTGLAQTPGYVNDQIFGIIDDGPINALSDFHPAVPGAWFGFLMVGSGALLWRRYQSTGL
jgi:ABC-2 type transport system permease protein